LRDRYKGGVEMNSCIIPHLNCRDLVNSFHIKAKTVLSQLSETLGRIFIYTHLTPHWPFHPWSLEPSQRATEELTVNLMLGAGTLSFPQLLNTEARRG